MLLNLNVCVTKQISKRAIKPIIAEFIRKEITFGLRVIQRKDCCFYEIWRESKTDEFIRGSGNHGEERYGYIVSPDPPGQEEFITLWLMGRVYDPPNFFENPA